MSWKCVAADLPIVVYNRGKSPDIRALSALNFPFPKIPKTWSYLKANIPACVADVEHIAMTSPHLNVHCYCDDPIQ